MRAAARGQKTQSDGDENCAFNLHNPCGINRCSFFFHAYCNFEVVNCECGITVVSPPGEASAERLGPGMCIPCYSAWIDLDEDSAEVSLTMNGFPRMLEDEGILVCVATNQLVTFFG